MPLVHGHSARARRLNIRQLVSDGYPERQAVAIAYRIARDARAEEDDELGEILSEDYWISPSDAREALDAVRRSVQSFDTDMRNAMAAGTIPPTESSEWAKWRRQFDEYYDSIAGSFAGWRLLDSTGVLFEAEKMATDLNAWRSRFTALTRQPTTAPGPVRTHVGKTQGPWSATLTALAAVGVVGLAWRIYKDIR